MAIKISAKVYELLAGYNINQDVLLPTFIDMIANSMIKPIVERIIGYSIEQKTQITEYYSGSGHAVLMLNRIPVVSLDSISIVDYNEMVNGIIPVTNLELETKTGIIKIRTNLNSLYYSVFPRGKDNIKITYTVGSDTIPDDLEMAVAMLTTGYALTHVGSKTGGGSLGVDGYNRNYGNRGKYTDIKNEMDRHAMILLLNYTNQGVIGI